MVVKGTIANSKDDAVSVIVQDQTSETPDATVTLSLAVANSLKPTLNQSTAPTFMSGVASPVFNKFRYKEQRATGLESTLSMTNPVVLAQSVHGLAHVFSPIVAVYNPVIELRLVEPQELVQATDSGRVRSDQYVSEQTR